MNDELNFRLSDETKESINKTIKQKFGISLEEYLELDVDEQHQLKENTIGKKLESDDLIWIGNNPYLGYITDNDINEIESKNKPIKKLFK